MARYRSGEICIDVFDLIDQVDDDDLLAACEARKLTSKNGTAVSLADVERAYDYLRQGDPDEALLILERLVKPKWKTLAEAEAALAKTRATAQ